MDTVKRHSARSLTGCESQKTGEALPDFHDDALSAVFDERSVLIASSLPGLVVALFGESTRQMVVLPRRPSRATRQHDVAVLCGDGSTNDSLRLRHLEWQTRQDALMAMRMLVYQIELVRAYRVPVESAVLYLVPPGAAGLKPAPSVISLYDGRPPLDVWYKEVVLPRLPAADFIQPDAPSLAVLSSACAGGCTFESLRASLRIIRSNYSESGTYVEMLALHFAFAELRSFGRRWKMAAQSVGIEVVEDVELDGFTQMVIQRYEAGRADGIEQGRAEGIEQGRAEGVEQGIERGIEQGVEQGIKQGVEQGRAEGIEQGRAEGIERERLRVARLLEAAEASGADAETLATLRTLLDADTPKQGGR